jgi:AcrR family transcriptional regulator
MSANAFPLPPMDRLPSGRHRLTREAVQESQRGRLLLAIAQVVSENGYAAATVADIVERASVSRTTFYQQFPDKESCFLEATQFAVEFVLGRMRDSWEGLSDPNDWRAHVRSDLTTYLETLVSEPAFARAIHVEWLSAGAAALERRAQILALFTERTKRIHELARREDGSVGELPDEVFALHTGGMDELVREFLRTHEPAALVELTEPAIAATLALLGDRPH